ncbi:MAG: hypothetical protein SPL73_04700 [Cyanobacteriota bacterium]|nr:hypothetical protein [Cyanobacteriota bacterium]MDY6364171.1 hypothetical protein [Cyanobacteriota bacterium]
MLVSLMARLSAISQMHNAQWAMMQNSRNMMNVARNLPFGGYNMQTLHDLDTRFALNNAQSKTLYMIAAAQEKAAAKNSAQEAKENKISYIA